MWAKHTVHWAKDGNFRTTEEFDGDFEYAKTMVALSDFSDVRDMFIEDKSTVPTQPVKMYRVQKTRDGIDFRPFGFHESAIEDIAPSSCGKAEIQLLAMTNAKSAKKMEEFFVERLKGWEYKHKYQ